MKPLHPELIPELPNAFTFGTSHVKATEDSGGNFSGNRNNYRCDCGESEDVSESHGGTESEQVMVQQVTDDSDQDLQTQGEQSEKKRLVGRRSFSKRGSRKRGNGPSGDIAMRSPGLFPFSHGWNFRPKMAESDSLEPLGNKKAENISPCDVHESGEIESRSSGFSMPANNYQVSLPGASSYVQDDGDSSSDNSTMRIQWKRSPWKK